MKTIFNLITFVVLGAPNAYSGNPTVTYPVLPMTPIGQIALPLIQRIHFKRPIPIPDGLLSDNEKFELMTAPGDWNRMRDILFVNGQIVRVDNDRTPLMTDYDLAVKMSLPNADRITYCHVMAYLVSDGHKVEIKVPKDIYPWRVDWHADEPKNGQVISTATYNADMDIPVNRRPRGPIGSIRENLPASIRGSSHDISDFTCLAQSKEYFGPRAQDFIQALGADNVEFVLVEDDSEKLGHETR